MEKETESKNQITVKLFDPIQWGDKEITELTIKAPRGKHMANLPKEWKMSDLAKVASSASGIEMTLLGELHVKDYNKVIEVTSSFLGDGE